MLDPVALAWSGRIDQAFQLACTQAGGDDPYAASQGLEALAVLGSQHGVKADDRVRRILLDKAQDPAPSIARRAFEAAMALSERSLEPLAVKLLTSGEARWEVLRYAGELPSHALAGALALGWDRLPATVRDEALLTSCAMPCASAEENEAWGRRALALVRDREESVRAAAFIALRIWAHLPGLEACLEAADDASPAVRAEAERTMAELRRLTPA